jgi:MYXO-CTERM domain-containing protein
MRRALIGVVAVLAIASVAGAVPIVTNGTFDSNVTGWTYAKSSWGGGNIPLASRDPATGVWFPGALSGNAAGVQMQGDYTGSHWIAQAVSGFVVGQSYTLSGDIAGGNTNGTTIWYQLGYVPGAYNASTIDSGTGCVNVVAGGANNASLPWTHGSGSFTATNTTYTIYYKYGAVGGNNYYSAYVDNVALTPEPVAALLLLAGLPMLRRRRA